MPSCIIYKFKNNAKEKIAWSENGTTVVVVVALLYIREKYTILLLLLLCCVKSHRCVGCVEVEGLWTEFLTNSSVLKVHTPNISVGIE